MAIAKKKSGSTAKKVSKTVAKKATKAASKTRGKKSAKPAKVMSPVALASDLGVTLSPPLKPGVSGRLRRALPGYAGMLDDVAVLLEDEERGFDGVGIVPSDLLEVQRDQKFLSVREGVVHAVYRSVYEQRLQVDDRGMKMLEKLARRVNALSEDDPSITTRWKLLLDFLGTFRNTGRRAKKAEEGTVSEPADAEPTEATTDEG